MQSRACYDTVRKHGKKVVIREPVKGGNLAALPKEAEDLLKALRPELSIASWGIRFAASLEGVLAVLSGMSTTAQVEDNISYMKHFEPLSEAEHQALEQVVEILKKQRQIPCTACRYCTKGCPQDIPIPEIFTAVNQRMASGQIQAAADAYAALRQAGSCASDCIACGACEQVCPQHLEIRKHLKEAASLFE